MTSMERDKTRDQKGGHCHFGQGESASLPPEVSRMRRREQRKSDRIIRSSPIELHNMIDLDEE